MLFCRRLGAAAVDCGARILARHTHKDGVELRRGAIFDRYASRSKTRLTVTSVHDKALGRHTMRAKLGQDGRPPVGGALFDVEMGWMSEERFALSGLFQHGASSDRPTRLVRQGWLCEYNVEEAEDDRPRRKNGALR